MTLKRILVLLASGILSVSMLASSAFAANVTMDGTASEYSAYRLLDLSQGLKPGHTDGDACDLTDAAAAAAHFSYRYSVNDKYADVIAAGVAAAKAEGQTVDETGYIEFISGLSGDQIRAFADAAYKAMGGLPADATASKTFSGLEDGYYLIAETATAGDGDSVSLVMLDTAGKPDITVTSKEDVPVLTKKITDESGNPVGDSDTVAVGDEVFYEITVTAPAADILATYETYKYVIHDDIGNGLRFDGITACLVDGSAVSDLRPDKTAVRGTDTMADDICDIEFTFNNVKSFLQGGQTLTVRYKCVVTEDAVAGESGNPNTAHLEFSNNPYATDETTESTTKDKVTVFTFALKVNKTDADGTALSGAGFTLYKGTKSGSEFTWSDAGMDVKAVEGDATRFQLSGLDEGWYKLVETTTPDGYQTCDDVIFEIRAAHDADSDDPQLTSLAVYDADGNSMDEFTATLADGSVATAVVNVTGSRLPTTGGAGTYLIYAGGAVLLMGGGLLLALRKKKTGDEA